MEEIIRYVVLAFVLAFIAEGAVEYLFKPLIDWVASKLGAESDTRYVGAAVGIALCFAYRLDLLGSLGYVAVAPWVGILLTGVLVGRGSNYLHDFVKRFILGNPIED